MCCFCMDLANSICGCLQKCITWCLMCLLTCGICIVMVLAIMMGVALGYHYSLSQYIVQKDANATIYNKGSSTPTPTSSTPSSWTPSSWTPSSSAEPSLDRRSGGGPAAQVSDYVNIQSLRDKMEQTDNSEIYENRLRAPIQDSNVTLKERPGKRIEATDELDKKPEPDSDGEFRNDFFVNDYVEKNTMPSSASDEQGNKEKGISTSTREDLAIEANESNENVVFEAPPSVERAKLVDPFNYDPLRNPLLVMPKSTPESLKLDILVGEIEEDSDLNYSTIPIDDKLVYSLADQDLKSEKNTMKHFINRLKTASPKDLILFLTPKKQKLTTKTLQNKNINVTKNKHYQTKIIASVPENYSDSKNDELLLFISTPKFTLSNTKDTVVDFITQEPSHKNYIDIEVYATESTTKKGKTRAQHVKTTTIANLTPKKNRLFTTEKNLEISSYKLPIKTSAASSLKSTETSENIDEMNIYNPTISESRLNTKIIHAPPPNYPENKLVNTVRPSSQFSEDNLELNTYEPTLSESRLRTKIIGIAHPNSEASIEDLYLNFYRPTISNNRFNTKIVSTSQPSSESTDKNIIIDYFYPISQTKLISKTGTFQPSKYVGGFHDYSTSTLNIQNMDIDYKPTSDNEVVSETTGYNDLSINSNNEIFNNDPKQAGLNLMSNLDNKENYYGKILDVPVKSQDEVTENIELSIPTTLNSEILPSTIESSTSVSGSSYLSIFETNDFEKNYEENVEIPINSEKNDGNNYSTKGHALNMRKINSKKLSKTDSTNPQSEVSMFMELVKKIMGPNKNVLQKKSKTVMPSKDEQKIRYLPDGWVRIEEISNHTLSSIAPEDYLDDEEPNKPIR